MSATIRRSSRRAFSLIEVLVALVILATLSVAVYGFLFELISTRAAIRDRVDRDTTTTALVSRVEQALMTCEVSGPDGAAGVSGSATNLTVASRGVHLDTDATHAAARPFAISFDEGRRVINATIGASEPTPAMNAVERLRIRYHDGRSWRSSFDAASAGRLPAAIELAIWYGDPPAETADETAADPNDLNATTSDPELADNPAFLTPLEDLTELETDQPERLPDFVRVIATPDGADAGWEVADGA